MSDEEEKVKLVIENVSATDRALFNSACRSNNKSRGEVVSDLMRQYAENTYGVGHATYLGERGRRSRAIKAFTKSATGSQEENDIAVKAFVKSLSGSQEENVSKEILTTPDNLSNLDCE